MHESFGGSLILFVILLLLIQNSLVDLEWFVLGLLCAAPDGSSWPFEAVGKEVVLRLIHHGYFADIDSIQIDLLLLLLRVWRCLDSIRP